MKTILLLLFAAAAFFIQEKAPRLNGTYKVVYDKNYGLQPYTITFSDSTYIKKMPDAVTTKGKIHYEKYKVTLRKNNDEDPVVIDIREAAKDTIKFVVKSKADLSRNVHYGRFIRSR